MLSIGYINTKIQDLCIVYDQSSSVGVKWLLFIIIIIG